MRKFYIKHAVAQPAKRQWRCEKQRKACANTTKHACPKKPKQTQSNCPPVHQCNKTPLTKLQTASFAQQKLPSEMLPVEKPLQSNKIQ